MHGDPVPPGARATFGFGPIPDVILDGVSPFRRLLGYVRPYRRAFLIGLACVVLTQGIALAAPLVLQHAIDDLAAGITGSKLALYGGLLLAIGLVGGVFRF